MFRGFALAALVALLPQNAAPTTSVLHITVLLQGTGPKASPIPRYALLISDNPSSAPPRRLFTSPDGSLDVRLPPGNYTVESDRPLAFEGKAYQWTQIVDVVAGRDTVLALTADNAEAEAITGGPAPDSASPVEPDATTLLAQWQESVVGIWTATTHASAFLVDPRGLLATNQRGLGGATSVEVQLTPEIKVAAHVLVADAVRDVAVLWMDPGTVASLQPVPLGCGREPTGPAMAGGQEVIAIEAPLGQLKGTTTGAITRVGPSVIITDLLPGDGGAGGPVFGADGRMLGITSLVDDRGDPRRGDTRVVRVSAVCDVVASVEPKVKGGAPPTATRLPVEPVGVFPDAALEAAVKGRAGTLSPYRLTSSAFDIAIMTPVQVYAARHRPAATVSAREPEKSTRPRVVEPSSTPPLMDFGHWSDYFADFPPVVVVRVTPRLVESFWTKVARGAAQTQGVALPPIRRFTSGFLRMRAYCGDAEIAPIHPFKIERRVSETDAIVEGLYVFDPGAMEPGCPSVKLVLHSEKEPDNPDTQIVDPKIVRQIWQDFAPMRDAK
jgi:hypothetical protein